MWGSLLLALAGMARGIGELIANHQAVSVLAFGALIVTMPEDPVVPFIPKGPWKWMRDAGQAFWNSRNPNVPPPPAHPTQPALTVPDQPKP